MKSDQLPDFVAAEEHIKTLLGKNMPDLQYHNLDHILDVLEAAMLIGENEKLTENEIKMLRLAALLHDIGFIQSSDNHEELGSEMVTDILPAYGFNADQIKVIQGMIMATRIPQSPKTKLEQVICDADLDYLGRSDFYEIGNRLFEELSSNGIVKTDREWNLLQKKFLESHCYHTNFSRRNREGFKQKRLEEIIDKLKLL